MSKKATQMPDKNYNFIQLQQLWKEGSLTLEEGVTQLLYALFRFEERRQRLDFKLMPYQPLGEEFQTLQTYESIKAAAESQEFIEAMQTDKSAAYKAMDFALEHYTTLELRFMQMEREVEAMIQKLDNTSSHLN